MRRCHLDSSNSEKGWRGSFFMRK